MPPREGRYRIPIPEDAGGSVEVCCEMRLPARSRPRVGIVTLLHGLGSSQLDWEESTAALSTAGHATLTIDLRGHGLSTRGRGPFDIDRHTRDVLAVLDALDVRSTDLIGLSLGAQIALELAASHAERFDRLVVAACAMDTRRHRPRVLWNWLLRTLILRCTGLDRSSGFIARKLFPKPEQHELRETFIERWKTNDTVSYGESLQGAFGWTVRKRLRHFGSPTLIVGADRDFIPVSELLRLRAELPNARVEIVEDCGHAIPVERPEIWNRLLIDHLDRP